MAIQHLIKQSKPFIKRPKVSFTGSHVFLYREVKTPKMLEFLA